MRSTPKYANSTLSTRLRNGEAGVRPSPLASRMADLPPLPMEQEEDWLDGVVARVRAAFGSLRGQPSFVRVSRRIHAVTEERLDRAA